MRNMIGLNRTAGSGLKGIRHSAFFQAALMPNFVKVQFSGETRVCTGLKIKKYVKRPVKTRHKIAVVDIMRNMNGLDLFVRDGSTTIYHSAFYQGDHQQDLAKVHLSGEIRVFTGLKMNEFVTKAVIIQFKIAVVAIMRNMTGLDLFVQAGSTTIYHSVFYQGDLLQDFVKTQSNGGMRVSTGLRMKISVEKPVLIHQN